MDTPVAFAPGCLVKIELPDALLLGEICYRRPKEGGVGYLVGVKISHRLRELGQYDNLRRAMQA